MDALKRFVKGEEGQDLVEYALIAGLVSIIAVVAITAAGVSIDGIWNAITTNLQSATGGAA